METTTYTIAWCDGLHGIADCYGYTSAFVTKG
jgi:hypothetical protein